MYDALYNPNFGLGGFRCRECKRVTRTERGIKMHCWYVHKKRPQLEMFDAGTNEPVRPAAETGRICPDCGMSHYGRCGADEPH